MRKKILGENKALFSPSWTKRRAGQSCTSRTGTERRGPPVRPASASCRNTLGQQRPVSPAAPGQQQKLQDVQSVFLMALSLQLWEVSEVLNDTTVLTPSVHITVQRLFIMKFYSQLSQRTSICIRNICLS